MHLLREAPTTRSFLSDPIQDALIMVQKLPEGREKVERVEIQAVEDVCLIARNALDRIGELERALARSRRYQARVQKYRTTCPKCGSTKKQKECRKCIV
jgi:hypothetical protein